MLQGLVLPSCSDVLLLLLLLQVSRCVHAALGDVLTVHIPTELLSTVFDRLTWS